MIGGGDRYDRAACRDMEHTRREVAHARQESGRFCSSDAQTVDAVKGDQHLARLAVNPRSLVCGLLCFSQSALCRCRRVDVRAYATCCVPRRMYTRCPEVRSTGFVCVRVPKTTATTAPDYLTICSSSVASHWWSRVLAPQRVNPLLLLWEGRSNVPSKFTLQQQQCDSSNLSGNVMPLS